MARFIQNCGTKILKLHKTGHFTINLRGNATFDCKPFKVHKLQSKPASKCTISKEDALKLYKDMVVIRRMEQVSANLYKEKEVRGFLHLYSGQEAICVGMRSVMRAPDTAITAYRAHGWTYVMGVSALGVVAELCGKKSGCARGKGGSMHTYAKNFYGGNGIVGAQVPLGAGLGFAHKYKGDGGVCFALYGDGAANQGQIFEVFNMTKLWNVPVIYICENNGYAMGTSTSRSAASTVYYTRGDYIPGLWIDGMDILTVIEATKFAIDYVTKNGPLIIEAETYRYFGHSMSDPGTSYRKREEINRMRETRDPISHFKEKIVKANLVPEAELKKIDDEVKIVMDEVVKKSKTDTEPSLSELVTDTYSMNYHPSIRNCLPWSPIPHTRLGPAVNMK